MEVLRLRSTYKFLFNFTVSLKVYLLCRNKSLRFMSWKSLLKGPLFHEVTRVLRVTHGKSILPNFTQ